MVISDPAPAASDDRSSTPAGDPNEDDFFSSWDKPSIKRPTPTPSRTATPPVVGGRTPSPFLSANPNGNEAAARPKSSLATADDESATTAPQATRTTSSSAIRKSTTTSAPRRTNVLGAKKTQKLGVKKVSGGDAIDFEAAEKKAKEEAERAEKLGYNPEAEAAAAATKPQIGSSSNNTKIASPSPISPEKASFGSTSVQERSSSEMDRLGMGIGRLGFGQVGGGKSAPPQPKKLGFGSTGGKKGGDQDGQFCHSYSPYQ